MITLKSNKIAISNYINNFRSNSKSGSIIESWGNENKVAGRYVLNSFNIGKFLCISDHE